MITAMGDEAIEILKKALHAPLAERAELAGSLIESPDESNDESVQAAWDAEIIRRIGDVDLGRVRPLSLAEARRKLSSSLD